MSNKNIAFQNANMRDPTGAVVPVTALEQPNGSFSLATDSVAKTIPITYTSGSGGNVVVASTAQANGFLDEVYVDVGSSGSTLAITLQVVQDNGPTVTLLTLTGVAASGSYRPRYPTHDSSGATDGNKTFALIHGTYTITVTQAGNAKSGTVYVTCI